MNNFVNKPSKINKPAESANKVRLPVVGNRVSGQLLAQQRVFKLLRNVKSPADPGCSTCVGACCYKFFVALTQDEYESGLYAPYAVKVTPEDISKLGRVSVGSALMLSKVVGNEVYYALEGTPGSYCPFFKNGCTIYDKRPFVCKVYTCAGDDRITDEIRSGK